MHHSLFFFAWHYVCLLVFLSANKFWSGLLEGYYLPRASIYFSHLSKSLIQNQKFKLNEWQKEWISRSNKWQEGNEFYPVKAKGDALAIARVLYGKYCAETSKWQNDEIGYYQSCQLFIFPEKWYSNIARPLVLFVLINSG